MSTHVIGLSLLGFLASPVLAQNVRASDKLERPSERRLVQPVRSSWSELTLRQERLDQAPFVLEQGFAPLPEPPTIDVGEPAVGRVPASFGTAPGGVEALGCPGFGVEPPLGVEFEAQGDGPDGSGTSFIPPNVAGSVGPDHLMVMLSNKVHVQDRLGGSVQSLDTLTFWSPLAAPAVTYCRVYYDLVSGRWLTTARGGVIGGATTVMFAISAGSDPTGSWTYYSTPGDPGGSATFPDWLTMGYNQTWVAVAANMFNSLTFAAAGTRLYTFDMAAALAGGAITITTFPASFWSTGTGTGGVTSTFTLHPARSLDSSLSALWLFNNSFTAGGTNNLVQMASITGTGPAPVFTPTPGSVFGGNTSLFQVATNYSNTQLAMPQVGDARFITSFSTRIASVAARNGRLWLAHSCGLPGPANNGAPTSNGIAWYELDPTLFPAPEVQSGQLTDGAGTVASYPSLAVNCADDVILGFSRGNAAVNPECAYAIRLGTDALGTMGPTRLLKAGDSSYWKNFGVGTNAQWGFYSSSSVDPLDDRTLWTLQQYAGQRVGPADNDSRWSTRWGRVGSCGGPTITDDPDPVTVSLGDPAAFSVTATASTSPLAYQWRRNGNPIVGANASTFSIVSTGPGDAGNYDVVVSDGCGSVVSLPAALTFDGAVVPTKAGNLAQFDLVLEILAQPESQQVCEGDLVVFEVASTSINATYLWRKDGVPLAPAETGSTLVLGAAAAADAGVYDVVVSRGPDTLVSDPAVLVVDTAPTIVTQPGNQTLFEGQTAVFTVVASGSAPLSYQWQKRNRPFTPFANINGATSATLTIPNVDGRDTGQFRCIVTNGCGQVITNEVRLSLFF